MQRTRGASSFTLSVCCVTNGPFHQVATLLDLLRPIADEIVVLVDSASTNGDPAPVLELADVAYTAPVGPIGSERVLNWLHRECSADWILRLDSDEVPSRVLLDALPALLRARDVIQYHLPRRWCFPDAAHWLDERPWAPDWQLRLVRNLPGMRFTPDPWHAGLAPREPSRYVELPLYHLDCATEPQAGRARKAAAYEQLRPGHATDDGTAVNAYYLPEQFATRRPVPVPRNDLAIIEEVMRAKQQRRTRGRRPASARAVSPQEIAAVWPLREIPKTAYKATLTVQDPVPALRVGASTALTVRVINQGTEMWPYGDYRPAFRLAHRWTTRDGTVLEGRRTMFTADLEPNQEIVQPMWIEAPAAPGDYTLHLDVVHEGMRWLECGPSLAVTVRP